MAETRGKLFCIAEIFVLALLIYAFQILLEFVQFKLGLDTYLIYLLNAPIAAIIIGLIFGFRLRETIPRFVRTNVALLYVSIQFVVGTMRNATTIQSAYGTIFNMKFVEVLGISVLIFVVMYFILSACLDVAPRLFVRKKTCSCCGPCDTDKNGSKEELNEKPMDIEDMNIDEKGNLIITENVDGKKKVVTVKPQKSQKSKSVVSKVKKPVSKKSKSKPKKVKKNNKK
jgi:hypothetical protein